MVRYIKCNTYKHMFREATKQKVLLVMAGPLKGWPFFKILLPFKNKSKIRVRS